MGFTNSISIGYKDIFEDYDKVSIQNLIINIPSKNIIEVVGFFNAQVHTIERDSTKQVEFLNMWVGRLPEEVLEKINFFIIRTNSSPDKNFNFINNVSSLILIGYVLQNYNELEKVKNLTPEQELNLFKAYLFCTDEWLNKQSSTLRVEKITTKDELVNILLPLQLPYQEVLEFKEFTVQFIKAIYFFRFCDTNPHFKGYMNLFLTEYKIDSWQRYLTNILNLYVNSFQTLNKPINVPVEFLDIINFLDSLSIRISDFSKSDDFLSLREKPVYKMDDSTYIFLNLNFLVDKLFQTIQFEFAKVLIGNKAVFKGKIIKNFSDFKSVYGEEFSENGLFYKVLDYVFEKSNFFKYNGQELKMFIGDGEPDYYMRDKAKVYLFEYKDVLLNAKTKHSYDFTEIKSEIFKKLVRNEKGAEKGVTQLVSNIKKVRNNEFKKFDDYDFENVIIYPILIYTDFSFNISGINQLLNVEFRRQIDDKKVKNPLLIKDLVLIDLDTLIKFQDLFRDKRLKINNCLNEYLEFVKMKENLFDKISTFNMFIHNKTKDMKYDSPKMLYEELKAIFPKKSSHSIIIQPDSL